MHKIILFRGGMCGDLVLSMLSKEYIRSIYPLKPVRHRINMKKYYEYSYAEKKEYLDKMDGYTLSHDTEFCRQIDQEQVIQIFCSNNEILPTLADRFWEKNTKDGVEHVKKDLNLNKNYTLLDDFKKWQDFHKFKYRFDIKNVYNEDFVSDVEKAFDLEDKAWASTIHRLWLKEQ